VTPLRILLALTLSTLFTAGTALACSPPSQPGAVICYPTSNASVVPILNIEGAAKGSNSPIVAMTLYADNQKIYSVSNADTFVYADRQAWQFGSHHLVLNAWDSAGNLFQASTTFRIEISIYTTFPTSCSTPATGVNLCEPVSNTWYPQSFAPFTATGNTSIVTMKGYVNGQEVVGNANGRTLNIGYYGNPTPSGFTFVANGWDSKGNVSSAKATGIHVYYDGACIGRSGCDSGITIQQPAALTDQPSPFSLDATVQGAQATITGMKAYLDNSVVATSGGPTILSSVTATPGTHLLTVQAWDSSGNLYKSQVTVNVQ
jgi:hypothetical protein